MLLALLIIVPLLFLYTAFSWGYVLSCMYQWFILSAIPTMPMFTVVQFIGFSLFANTLIRHTAPKSVKAEYAEDGTAYLVGQLILPWSTWLFAWAFHAYYF